MNLLLVGLPGALFDWVRAGLQQVPGTQLRCAHHLSPELAAGARAGQFRVVACMGSLAGARDTMTLAQMAAALYAMGDLAGVDVLWVDHHSEPSQILSHCGLPAVDLPPPPPAVSDAEIETLLAAAQAYARHAERQSQIWPRALLFDGDHPDRPLPRVIELTGPARTLAYGPYIGFSPGPARLAVLLAVAPTCRHGEMAIELHGTHMLGRGKFTLTQPGLFSAEIDVVVGSAREPLEIRLKSERGAIEGEIGVDHVSLAPR